MKKQILLLLMFSIIYSANGSSQLGPVKIGEKFWSSQSSYEYAISDYLADLDAGYRNNRVIALRLFTGIYYNSSNYLSTNGYILYFDSKLVETEKMKNVCWLQLPDLFVNSSNKIPEITVNNAKRINDNGDFIAGDMSHTHKTSEYNVGYTVLKNDSNQEVGFIVIIPLIKTETFYGFSSSYYDYKDSIKKFTEEERAYFSVQSDPGANMQAFIKSGDILYPLETENIPGGSSYFFKTQMLNYQNGFEEQTIVIYSYVYDIYGNRIYSSNHIEKEITVYAKPRYQLVNATYDNGYLYMLNSQKYLIIKNISSFSCSVRRGISSDYGDGVTLAPNEIYSIQINENNNQVAFSLENEIEGSDEKSRQGNIDVTYTIKRLDPLDFSDVTVEYVGKKSGTTCSNTANVTIKNDKYKSIPKGIYSFTITKNGTEMDYTNSSNISFNGCNPGDIIYLKRVYSLGTADSPKNNYVGLTSGIAIENKYGDKYSLTTEVTPFTGCLASETGAIKAKVNGGIGPYTYEFGTGYSSMYKLESITTNNLSQKFYLKSTDSHKLYESDKYIVYVTDKTGCKTTKENISVPVNKLAVQLTPHDYVGCVAANNAKIDVSITNKNEGTFNYNLYNGILTNNQIDQKNAISNLDLITSLSGTGDYKVKITDSKGCTAEAETYIGLDDFYIEASENKNYKYCEESSVNDDVQIKVTPHNASSPDITYYYNNVKQSNPYIKPKIESGKSITGYNVYADDGKCKSKEKYVGIYIENEVKFDYVVSDNVTGCENNKNGRVCASLGVFAGNGSYSFSNYILNNGKYEELSTSNNSESYRYEFKDLPVGTYHVVASSGGCTITSEDVSVGVDPMTVKLIPDNYENCINEDSKALVEVQINNPVGESSYKFFDGNGKELKSGKIISYANIDVSPYDNYGLGKYSIKVENTTCGFVGENSKKATAEVKLKNKVDFDITPKNISCYGSQNGSIKINNINNFNKGEGFSMFLKKDKEDYSSLTETNLENLKPGKYYIKISDNKCSLEKSATITEPAQYKIVDDKIGTDVKCYGGSDGAITIKNVKQGNDYRALEGWSVSVDNGQNWKTAISEKNNYVLKKTDLKAGQYNIKVKDKDNCESETKTVTITEPKAELTVDKYTYSDVTCFENKDGIIEATGVTGGTMPYTIVIKDGTDKEFFPDLAGTKYEGLDKGTYTAYVKDENGCATNETDQIVINKPESKVTVSDDNIKSTKADCNQENNGSITVKASGGNGGYTYTLSNNIDNQSLNNNNGVFKNLLPTNYTLNVKDSNGCSFTKEGITVENSNLLKLDKYIPTPVLCYGDNTGTITAKANFGKTGFNSHLIYKLNSQGAQDDQDGQEITGDNDNEVSFYNLPADTYTVTVQPEGSECVVTENVTVTQPINELSFTVDPINCKTTTSSDGELKVYPSGGTPDYTIDVTDMSGNAVKKENYKNLPPDTYTVSVSDANGCEAQPQTATIAKPDKDLSLVVKEYGNVDCNGNSTGLILVEADGGWNNYKYSISGPMSDENKTGVFNNLVAGEYTITVTDFLGVTASVTQTITQPEPLTSSAVVKDANCFGSSDGVVTFSISGGTSGYTLNLDGKGYESDKDGKVKVEGLSSKTYLYDVVDANGCVFNESVIVGQPEELLVKADGNNYNNYNIKCFGDTDTLKVAASGGIAPYSFSLDGDIAQTVSGSEYSFIDLPQGKYQVVCVDAHGCKDTVTQELTQPDKLVISSIDTVRPSCYGYEDGRLTVNVEGGIFASDYYYYFDKAKNPTLSEVYSGLKSGVHSVKVVDANQCVVDTTIKLGQPEKFIAKIDKFANVSCFGESTGEISFDINGGTLPYYYSLDGADRTKFDESEYLLTGLPSKTDKYSILLTDENGCSVEQSQVITQPEQITAVTTLKDFNGYNIQCNGSTGEAEVAVAGGVGHYTVDFNGREYQGNRLKFSNLKAGEHSYKVTDENGCQRDFPFAMSQPDALEASVTPIMAKCFGLSDGKLDIDFTGGVPDYSYSVYDSVKNIIAEGDSPDKLLLNDLPAGLYKVKVTDANKCVKESSGVIAQPNNIEVTLLKKDISCKGAGDGVISATVTGGTQPYSYKWSNNGATNNNTISRLAQGVYTLQIIDNFGCKAYGSDNYPEASAEIFEPDRNLAFSGLDFVNPSCSYKNDGEISFTVDGGWGGYKYELNDMSFEGTNMSALRAGSYKVSVLDSNNCTISQVVDLVSPVALSFTDTADVISCYGGTTSINILSASGGTGSYSFSLDGGEWLSGIKFDNVSAGNHTIVMRDENKCEYYKERTVKENARLVIADELTQSNNSADPAKNNVIAVTASGGVAPYYYQWQDTNVTNSKLDNIGSGIYTVTVTDNMGCSRKGSYFINAANSPKPAVVDAVCPEGADGSIVFDESVGAANAELYTAIGNVLIKSSSNLSFTGLSKGIYKARLIYDDHSEYVYAEVSAPDSLELRFQKTDNMCYDGNAGYAELSIVGGVAPYDIVWQNASGESVASGLMASELVAGEYVATVADKAGCPSSNKTISVNISQPDEPFVIKPLTVNNASCYRSVDGSVWLTSTGNYGDVLYSFGKEKLTDDHAYDLKAGAHEFHAVDQHNCVASATVSVGEPDMIKANVGYTDLIRCHGMAGSVELKNVTGGTADTYSYKMVGDSVFSLSPVFANLYAGRHDFVIKDANGCSDTLKFNMWEPDPIKIMADVVKDEACDRGDGSITVNITSGNSLQSVVWNDSKRQNGNVAKNLSAGYYRVLVTDVNNCTADANYTVKNLSAPFLSVYDIKDVKCHGYSDGVAKLVLGGGTGSVIVDWCGSDSTAYTSSSKLKAGSHTVIATDSLGCADTVRFTVKQPDSVNYSIVASDPLCYGDSTGSATINISNRNLRYSYLWSTGATGTKATNLPAGDYSVAVTSPDGCVFNAGLSLSNPEKLVINEITSVSAKCSAPNGQITVNASGGIGTLMFSVDTSSVATPGVIANVTGGSHWVHVRDNNACVLDTLYAVGNIEAPVLAISNLSNVKCNGESNGSLTVKVDKGTAPFSYSWNSGKLTTQNSISGLAHGNYQVRVVDAYGCGDTLAFDISEPLKLTAYELSSTLPTCHDYSDGSVKVGVIGGTMPYTYLWSDGQNSDNAVKLVAGSHYVDVTDKNGCSDRKYFNLDNPNPVVVDIPDVVNICSNQTADLDAGNAGSFFLWSGADSFESVAQSISVKKAGTYNVTVTTPVGCVGTGSTLVNVSEKEINANFLLQSDAYVGDTIVMIEISWPLPESIEWACPDGVNIIEDGGDEIMFVADEVGSYNIGLTTYNDICMEQTFKSITVNPKDQKPVAQAQDKGKIIKSANVYPVPATGPFNLEIELNEDHDVNIEIVHISGKIQTVKHMKGDRHYILNFSNADMNAGIHTINITSGNESVTKKLVIVK